MRGARILFALMAPVVAALALAGCAHQQQTYYVIDPQTGQPVPVVSQAQQQQMAQPPDGEPGARGLFSPSPAYAQQSYAQTQYAQPSASPQSRGIQGLFSSSPAYAQQAYAQTQYVQPQYQPQPQPAPGGRGLFGSSGGFWSSAPQAPPPQTYVLQYRPPVAAAPQYAAQPQYAAPRAYAYAPSNPGQAPYTLDSGDKLRVVVFGQQGISNSYMVDAGGNISLPLVGSVPARGFTTQQLSQMIAERLKQGYVRDPHVSVEIETYRPFFILGEVTNPGQYPYVANMTAETAVAIAGGFAPRAYKSKVELTRNATDQRLHADVPLNTPLRPGDTIVVKERWF
jgi:polysaccharide export outer membrane protein